MRSVGNQKTLEQVKRQEKNAMKAHGEPDSDKREERKQKMDLNGKGGGKRGWARDVTTRNK